MAKAFEIPKDFSRKVLWSGFGADSPNLQYTQKSTAMPCFLFFHKQLELRSKPCFKALLKKHLKNPQNFHTETHHFTLAKLLKFSKKLFSKSFFDWGLGLTAPTFNATQKSTALPCFFLTLLNLRIFANGIFYHFKHTHGALFHERARKRSAFDRRNNAFDIAP